jgi:hypothetical protein
MIIFIFFSNKKLVYIILLSLLTFIVPKSTYAPAKTTCCEGLCDTGDTQIRYPRRPANAKRDGLVSRRFFLLHFVDSFNKYRFILILVTFRSQIKVMVDFTSNLLGFSIFTEKSSKDTLSSHPEDFAGHS